MWRVILLVFCYHVASQAEDESIRHTRELIECCPCPGSSLPVDLLRQRTSDDCPCRSRSADSEGASSMLFPSRTASPKNSVPFMRSNDPNDMKNLLEPEVGLAKSMLQTLREATEEEYRDALARDAARTSDAVPEESARNVVIIVKPRTSDNEDLLVPEASNVKETRCVNPLGPFSQMRTASKPLRTSPDLFRFTKPRPNLSHRNVWDMDSNVGASNVQPNVVNTGLDSKRLPLFKFRTPLKENPLRSLNNDGLKTPVAFRNRPNLFERFNLHVPQMKIDSKQRNNNNENTDLSSAPSNNKELMDKENDAGISKTNKRPPLFKNLFKLKDVELIPKTLPKLPIFKSKLDTDKDDTDDTCDDSNHDSAINEKVVMPDQVSSRDSFRNENVSDKDSSLQKVVEIVEPKEDQIDAITSPSEIIPIIVDKHIEESNESDCNNETSEELKTTTEGVSEVLIADESHKVLNHAVEPENNDTGNDSDNFSKSCETEGISDEAKEDVDEANEVSESDTDSSNNIVNVISSEDKEDSISQSQLEELEKEDPEDDSKDFISSDDKTETVNEPNSEMTRKRIIPNIKPVSSLSKTLSTIKENVKNSLESLKKTSNVIIPMTPRNGISDLKIDTPTTPNEPKELNMDKLIKETSNADNTFQENEDQVSFKDLQKLSDDLLVLSSNNKETFTHKEAEAESELIDSDFKPNADEKQQIMENGQDSIEIETSTIKTDDATHKDVKTTSSKGKACGVGFDEKETKRKPIQPKTDDKDEDNRDMAVEASAPKGITLPALLDPLNLNQQLGSSLLRRTDPFNLNSINVKEKLGSSLLPNLDPLNLNEKFRSPALSDPLNLNEKLTSPILPNLEPLNLNLGSSLLDPMNLNEKLPLFQPNLDPLNVRPSLQDIVVQPIIPNDPLNILNKPIAEVLKLPTLEDLRQRLSDVFDSNDRSAENNFSDEDSDCTNDSPVEMAHAASTNNLKKVPFIRPLEDINVDIFQLNPLSNTDPLSSAPRLNLNNFRTKLPIPSNFDLKPVKLESRVANNKGNVLGASLSFGNDKISRKSKPNSNKLGHPLDGLPSLDELRNTLQSSTQSLLGHPLHSNLDLVRDNSLRASGIPDIDEIRRNAEKTMKGLQQRMQATFKGGKISNPLGETFARPQDLLEDMSDKLKAIHYDLNDRLSSMHEDFLEQTRIKPLAIPNLPTISTNRNSNKAHKIWKPKGKPSRLMTSASTMSSIEMDPNNNDRSLLRSSAKNNQKRIQPNAHKKLLGAESSPIPSTVELPKYKTTLVTPSKSTLPSISRLPSSRQGSENTFPTIIRKPLVLPKQPAFVKDLKKPIFDIRKPNHFKDKTSKVTITFATTTASPVTSSMNTGSLTTPPLKHSKPDILKQSRESLKERLALSKSKPSDAKQSASNISPNVLSSVKSKNNFKSAVLDKDLLQPQNVDSTKQTKTGIPSFKVNKDKLRLNENAPKTLRLAWSDKKAETKNLEVLKEKNKAKPLVWPKAGDDSFLTKVREAMQARLNSFKPVKPAEKEEIPKVEGNTDMLKSASENQIVVADEPLKENVSYRCRMVCTRE